MENPTAPEQPLTDSEFLGVIYDTLLGRHPGSEEYSKRLSQLQTGGPEARKGMLWEFFESDEAIENRKKLRKVAEFVPPGHYYSAIPGPKERKEALQEKRRGGVRDIELNPRSQQKRLEEFKQIWAECKFTADPQENWRYYYNNPAYSWSDGFVLHAMMRLFKPAQIIEVGSGYSSAAMLDTREHYNLNTSLTFIEPYPDLLKSLLKPNDVPQTTLIGTRVQDVPLEVFTKLGKNDILFIDSTHVSKLKSDVNYLFFEVLPILKKGVIIHIHDIFYPFEYPKEWIREGRAWTELYLLRALLMNNRDYETLFFNHFAHLRFKDWFAKNIPDLQKNPGGAFWMKKRIAPAK